MDNDVSAKVILVVEDDPAVQELLGETLKDEGYQVLLAKTGEAALEQLRSVQPDLVTLDLNLPGLSGAQLLRAIRERLGLQHVPVIIVSAQLGIDAAGQKLAQAVVPKPFNLQELLDTIERLMPREHEPSHRGILCP
jgi:DNA-binding response OmpR family regulator